MVRTTCCRSGPDRGIRGGERVWDRFLEDGQKITRRLLWTVLALQVVAYFASQYIEFHSLGCSTTTARRWASSPTSTSPRARSPGNRKTARSARRSAPGDAFRLLEIVGFCGGSLAVPLLLRAVPVL